MQEFDEDSTITQLALAWVGMSYGKEKLKDSFYIYQEMIDKYGATPYLLVSQAACQIQQQKYEEAVKLLQVIEFCIEQTLSQTLLFEGRATTRRE